MGKGKECSRKLGLCIFGFTVAVGIVILCLCFISCPLLLSKIYGKPVVGYIMYFMGGFVVWVMLMAISCCLWRSNEVCPCFFKKKWNHETDQLRGVENGDLVSESEEEVLFDKQLKHPENLHFAFENDKKWYTKSWIST